MLQALELAGFKSFADRTRFEFATGVTCVVGPNGSGKSNVVDAIKWVLGSQSAKSLRGSEMIDVIFNGSASRRALNTAEATLVLGNDDGRLGIEAPQVAITRRVYRSGESEYLINRQPCRLKDIRELLAGTGIGTEAYSIIEQGKVDALLQASPRDRRAIFEEAAGISRFRNKRQEAIRRLERVDQNLLRLSDIVDEVETRLRSVRSQAGKAESYRRQSQRLQELRTALGLSDWQRLSRQLDDATRRLDASEQGRARQRQLITEAERQLPLLEQQLDGFDQQLSAVERELSQTRETRVKAQLVIKQQRGELARHDAHLADLQQGWIAELRVDPQPASNVPASDSTALRNQVTALREQVVALARQLESAARHARHTRTQTDEIARRHTLAGHTLELAQRELVSAESESVAVEEQLAAIRAELTTHEQQVPLQTHEAELAQQDVARLTESLRLTTQQLAEGQARLDEHEREVATLRTTSVASATELARLEQRAEILGELQRQRASRGQQLAQVLGSLARGGEVLTVADLLHVDVDLAPMIEAALGAAAEQVVVDTSDDVSRCLLSHPQGLPLRTVFARLDALVAASPVDRYDLTGQPGVIGRADSFVDTEPRYESLVRRLLGRTWLVDTLPTALRLAESIGRGLSFVTVASEVVGANGTIEAGPLDVGSHGLGTAQQRDDLRKQIAAANQAAALASAVLQDAERQLAILREQVRGDAEQQTQLTESLAVARQQTAQRELQHSQWHARHTQLAERRDELLRTLAIATEKQTTAQASLLACRTQTQQLAEARQQLLKTCEQADRQVAELREAHREAELELVRREQELTTAQQQMPMATVAARRQWSVEMIACHTERRQGKLTLLAATSELATAAWQMEQLDRQRKTLTADRSAIRGQRQQLVKALQETRREVDQRDNERQQWQLAATKVEHQRQTLADRLRDDYGIDLAKVAVESPEVTLEADRREVEQEIDQLRIAINRIGAVNTDALDELSAIEQRYEQISSQYNDLSKAKESLERIITRLNNDSRQLFFDTVETVRGHFRELFRRLFGGGEADLVLEAAEGNDPLDCGIEIQASPPGKDMRSITLLSGGEKTLTCVALLLAMFRSKPSPFCVLDEVDAALDEANIGRFTRVLSEFLTQTQFIVITHSKKTMTGASTLYGVTMQESGVSKQVSVRFDDVSEDGTINVAPKPLAA